jgi:hypothetical protein
MDAPSQSELDELWAAALATPTVPREMVIRWHSPLGLIIFETRDGEVFVNADGVENADDASNATFAGARGFAHVMAKH